MAECHEHEQVFRKNFTNQDPDGKPNKSPTTVDLHCINFGQAVEIVATRYAGAQYSTINLVTAESKQALHISIRPSTIVRNHLENKDYDYSKEEIDENLADPNVKNPITPGVPFSLKIFINENRFNIAIDGVPFCHFDYRLPLQDIIKVVLNNLGNIKNVDHTTVHPGLWPPSIYDRPDTIFSSDLPRFFKKFQVTLITAKAVAKDESQLGNLDLHFNAANESRELLLIRILMENGTIELKSMNEEEKYTNEESKSFALMANQPFKIGLSCLESQFEIAIDGSKLGTYKYVDADLLAKMTGLKIRTTKGLKVEVLSIEYKFFQDEKIDLEALTQNNLATAPEETYSKAFVSGLACPIRFAHSIIIAGNTGNQPKEPFIDFLTKEKDNIALRLLIDFKNKIIVRNSQIAGKWGKEERSENLFNEKAPNPISPDKKFNISFTASREEFFIAINGVAYCKYKYRVKLEDIIKISVEYMEKITQMLHHTALPSPWPIYQKPPNENEFANDIPIKFKPGHVIIVGGVPKGNGWFIMNFYDPLDQQGVMHFNARFDEKLVVRSSKIIGCESSEGDSSGNFPFQLNKRFRMAIAFTTDQFLFAINGKAFCSSKYQNPVLDGSTCLRVAVSKGLTLNVLEVDHFQLNADCKGYESLSKIPFLVQE